MTKTVTTHDAVAVANHTPKPKLLTVEDAKALDLPRMTELLPIILTRASCIS